MFVLGDVPVDDTLYCPFDTYGSNRESVTITGLAVTDIEIYKNGVATTRASDNGYALLDTDGIDFDGAVGLHGFSVDLSNNSDAGFYVAGSTYWINVNAITVDSQTVRFTYHFTIGKLLRPTTAGRTLDADANGRVDLGAWLGTVVTLSDGNKPDVNINEFDADVIDAAAFAANALVAATFATDSITADALAADAVTEIQSGLAMAAKLLAYVQLMARRDTAIETDNSTELAEMNADEGSGGGSYANVQHSQEATVVRGDQAWLTGAGSGATQSYTEDTNWTRTIGDNDGGAASDTVSVDGNTFSTGEVNSGTFIQVDVEFTIVSGESADTLDVWGNYNGGASHSIRVMALDTVSALYEDIGSMESEVGVSKHRFGFSPGHTDGTSVKVRFQHAAGGGVVAHAFHVDKAQVNTITPATPAPSAESIVDEWETQSQADPTGFHVNVKEVNGTAQTANDNGADINAILVDTGEIGTAGAGLTDLGGMSTAMKAEVNAEVDGALNTAIPGSPTANSINERIVAIDDIVPYMPAAIYINTPTGAAGTTKGTHGTRANPVNSVADAVTLAAAVGVNEYRLLGASSIILTTPHVNWAFYGQNGAVVDVGTGINTSGAHFECLTLTGDMDGNDTTQRFCKFQSLTNFIADATFCLLIDNVTESAGDHYWLLCASGVAGTGTPYIDADGDDVNARNNHLRGWLGGVEIRTHTSTDLTSFDCPAGQIVVAASGTGGTIAMRGNINITDNASGAVTFSQNAAVNMSKINAEVDTAFSDYDGPTNAEMEARTLVAASYGTAANQTNIQSRLPAALVTGRMSSDAEAISNSTDAADKVEAAAETMVTGAATATTLTTTTMSTNLTEATDDHYNGRVIIWTSGVLSGQATDITDYTGATKLLTFTAVTEAPSDADTFVIV